MSEWLKEHAWKACVGETLPRVRIPLSPPIKLFYGLDFLFSGPAVSNMSPKLRGVRGELLISWVFSSDVAILLVPIRLRRAHVVMKHATVCGDAGAEVGFPLVLTARLLVGPGVPRAPRIATPASPESAHLRFRLRGLHASVLEGDVSWRSCIRGVQASMCMPAASPPARGSRPRRRSRTTITPYRRRLGDCSHWPSGSPRTDV